MKNMQPLMSNMSLTEYGCGGSGEVDLSKYARTVEVNAKDAAVLAAANKSSDEKIAEAVILNDIPSNS